MKIVVLQSRLLCRRNRQRTVLRQQILLSTLLLLLLLLVMMMIMTIMVFGFVSRCANTRLAFDAVTWCYPVRQPKVRRRRHVDHVTVPDSFRGDVVVENRVVVDRRCRRKISTAEFHRKYSSTRERKWRHNWFAAVGRLLNGCERPENKCSKILLSSVNISNQIWSRQSWRRNENWLKVLIVLILHRVTETGITINGAMQGRRGRQT